MGDLLEKKSVGELKALLQAKKLKQTGEKQSLIHRLRLYQKIEDNMLRTKDGRDPFFLSLSELRKIAASEGCSSAAVGDVDEILEEYVNTLLKKSIASTSTSTNSDNLFIDPIKIAQKVLELDETEDYEGILGLAVSGVTRETPLNILRKAYLKISLLIHPDKLQSKFNDATKAFQALVKAYDRITSPVDEASLASAKAPTVPMFERSNKNCFRTKIQCPRCKQPWNERNMEGNPEYYYNFMMQGLKQFHCATCLCEFGCMTALHGCPFCKKHFSYSISDYHNQVECRRCEKKFGFYHFSVSERVLKDFKAGLREEVIKRNKIRSDKIRRFERSKNRTFATESIDLEKLFLLGLEDTCPRCGVMLEGIPNYEDQMDHLRNCNDMIAHKKHSNEKKLLEIKQKKRDAKHDRQIDVQTNAVWTFIGGNGENLLLLQNEDLRIRALEYNISDVEDRNREELEMKIQHKRQKLLM